MLSKHHNRNILIISETYWNIGLAVADINSQSRCLYMSVASVVLRVCPGRGMLTFLAGNREMCIHHNQGVLPVCLQIYLSTLLATASFHRSYSLDKQSHANTIGCI